MSMFQTLQSIKGEFHQVLAEEGGSYVAVDIFEWKDIDMETKKPFMNYDVEINLFNEQGERIDCWVTDILPDKNRAIKRAKSVIASVNRWVSGRPQTVLKGYRTYNNRSEIEKCGEFHRGIKRYTGSFFTEGRKKRAFS